MDVNATKETDEVGTLETAADGRSVLRYRRRLAHPPEKVWRALTEDGHLAAWFPTTIEGPRQAGAALRFSFRNGEGEPFAGEMLAFEPPSLLELRWSDDVLRFELEAAGTGSVLSLIVTFPEHGKAARDGAGWHVCLERLAAESDGTTPPADDRWRVVHARYVGALGPEASTIGPPG
ncbi:MAG TPA: SRPBCC family protein [Acidimicrobiales bacterium]|nr:SRPBCC family protein [Acidimicrobiales bacterium]